MLGLFHKPLEESLLTNQVSMESRKVCFVAHVEKRGGGDFFGMRFGLVPKNGGGGTCYTQEINLEVGKFK